MKCGFLQRSGFNGQAETNDLLGADMPGVQVTDDGTEKEMQQERATPHQGYVLYKMQSGAEICGVQGHRAYDGRLKGRLTMTDKEFDIIFQVCADEMDKETAREPIWTYVPVNAVKFKRVCAIMDELAQRHGGEVTTNIGTGERFDNSGTVQLIANCIIGETEDLKSLFELTTLVDSIEICPDYKGEKIVIDIEVKNVTMTVGYNKA